MIARNGTNNGFWIHSRHLWWQNENTNLLKDHVDRRSFNELLADFQRGPKSPGASLRCLKPRPGFTAELVASEPLVQDPIAFAWGPDGKFWVVEMGDYPLGTDGKGKHGGRVKFLEDPNGDGKYDKATVFLDGLGYPTGVLPWRKGVLVTCAPEIFYAEDTDGDSKADVRKPLYTGFFPGNQQHRVNGLVWGLDNWVYGANGDSGGLVKSVQTGKSVNIGGRDFRIRPDTGEIETQSGQTQFGRNRDDWGNWFGGNNANPMWHYALDEHYLRRNPHVAAPDPRVHVSVMPGAAPVYPISQTFARFNDFHTANRFTSACSPIVYRDELFGPHFADNVFISEPVHNLVHREVMRPDGFSFKSRRAPDEERSEFLASSDNWFRPTMIQTGPDGALWVCDMYRHVIEHPEWIPLDWQKKLDLRAGHDKGRIYRVYPVGTKPRAIPRLDKLDTAGLVAALDSPNGWQRDMAQMLLVEKKDPLAAQPLVRLALNAKRPQARLHALCTLADIPAHHLMGTALSKALSDQHPGVRRQAMRLCERFPDSTTLGEALGKMVDDPDPQVRLQLANTLGQWKDPPAGEALARLALRDGHDRYLLAAVLSSVNKGNLDAVLLKVLAGGPKAPPALLENLLRMANALGSTGTVATLLERIAAPNGGRFAAWQFTALAGLLDSLDQRNISLAKLQETGDGPMKNAIRQTAGLFGAARKVMTDKQTAHEERLAAIHLLARGLDGQEADLKMLADLLVPQTADELQAAAVAQLGRLRDKQVPETLLRGWKGYGPSLRSQVLDVLLRRDDWVKAALDAVEKGQVLPFEIDAAHRQRLLEHRNAAVRDRAAKLFAGSVNSDRQKVVDSYKPALSLTGDSTRGLQVFTKTCAACHKLGTVGQQVGPDLAALNDKSAEYLLVNILDPNRAVEARYVNYLAATKNGQTFNGVLASETANNVTLIGTDGKPQTILRTDLDELTSTGKSAMPDGMEKDIPPQDMADLFAYLRSSLPSPKPKTFAGQQPEVVRPAGDGSLDLRSFNCEIYGSTLVFEPRFTNLGYWSSEDDRAVWQVIVSRPGKFEVWLNWSCPNDTAGNAFVLEAGEQRLTGKVKSTGAWENYRREKVGEITLAEGKQRVTFRSAGKITNHLIDLRAVKLVPLSGKK